MDNSKIAGRRFKTKYDAENFCALHNIDPYDIRQVRNHSWRILLQQPKGEYNKVTNSAILFEKKFNVKKYIKLAEELCYKRKYIDMLQECTNHDETARVLHDARNDI